MGAKYDGGVRFYTKATLTAEVNFPKDDVCCQNCKFLTAEYLLKRSRCCVTSEIIPDPEYMIGGLCPLKFNNEPQSIISLQTIMNQLEELKSCVKELTEKEEEENE